MKTGLIALCVLLAFATPSVAQDTTAFVKKVFSNAEGSIPYSILFPKNYDPNKKYTLVLFLHGEEQRGNDNEKQLAKGAPLFLKDDNRTRNPSIVVFPQCPADDSWSNMIVSKNQGKPVITFGDHKATKTMNTLVALQQSLLKELPVDKNKVYLLGISDGATGAYELISRMPNTFAAAVIMGGAGDTTLAKPIRKTAFSVFHNSFDDVIPVQNCQDMVNALQQFYDTTDMEFMVYPTKGHNCWDKALAEASLLKWLYAQQLQK